MTDEQIIKALEICLDFVSGGESRCIDCPLHDCDNCSSEKLKFALDLINRKDAKIELLTMDVNSLTSERDALQEMVKEQKAEIERLKEYETALKKGCALSRCINKGFVQDEAYKEFAERLKQSPSVTNCENEWLCLDIDNILKELTEGGNEDG